MNLERAARRATRSLGLLVAALLCLTSALALPAAADELREWVRVELQAMTPTVINSTSDVVTLSGVIRNTSSETLTRVQAVLWRNQAPVVDSQQFERALQSGPNDPPGNRMSEPWSSFQDLTQSDDPATKERGLPPTFPPGATAKFQVQATAADLALPAASGVYLIGIHIRAARAPVETNPSTVGRARTFTVVAPPAPAATADVAQLIALTAKPSFLPTKGFTRDDLAAQLAPGGELDKLLDLGLLEENSVLVDPALVQAARALAEPHQLFAADGTSRTRAAQPAAKQWLAKLAKVPADRLFRMGYAQPDLIALAHARQPAPDEIRLGAKILPTVPLLTLLPGGMITKAAWDLANSQQPKAIAIARTTTGAAAPVLATGGTPVINISPADRPGPGPGPQGAVEFRQRFAAETLLQANERAPAAVRLITASNQATARPAWVREVKLASLLANPTGWTGSPQTPEPAGPTAGFAARERLRKGLITYRELIMDADSNRDAEALAVAASSHWAFDPKGLRRWAAPLQAEVDRALGGSGVSIRDANNVVLSSRDTNGSPLIIANDLEQPVLVHLTFTSSHPQRLQVPEVRNIEVGPQQLRAVVVSYQPKIDGEVRVSAQLTTRSGSRVAKPVNYNVSATNLGMLGWVIVLASGAVLFISTFTRIRQVRRENAAKAATLESGTSDLVDTRGPQTPLPTEQKQTAAKP